MTRRDGRSFRRLLGIGTLVMKHLPTMIGAVVLVAALVWLYLYAPCGVFYWNNTKDVPERCHAALGRG